MEVKEALNFLSLKDLEDAALPNGDSDHGQPVGAFADAEVLSFGAHKTLGSVGNCRMVITNNPALAETVELLRNSGLSPH